MHKKNKKQIKRKPIKKRHCTKYSSQNYTNCLKRKYAPSNYIYDKYSQYRIGMDNYWPPQITEIPFYNDVYYSMPNSLGSPIYTKPSYDTLQNASHLDVIQNYTLNQPQQFDPMYYSNQPMNQSMNQSMYQPMNQLMNQPMNQSMNQPMNQPNEFMERDSYFNTINANNKEIDYKKFMDPVVYNKKKLVERKIKYIDKNTDYINIIIILLLILVIFLNR